MTAWSALTAAGSRRWLLAGLALGLLVGLAVMAGTNGSEPDAGLTASAATTPSPALDVEARRQALEEFEEAVEQVVDDGGFVVTQGMQPGLADIAEQRYDDETLLSMARGWRNSLRDTRDEFTADPPPSFLAAASDLYVRALDGYIEAADGLIEAAKADGARRTELLEEEIPRLGRAADRLWEAARDELNDQRRALGVNDGGDGADDGADDRGASTSRSNED